VSHFFQGFLICVTKNGIPRFVFFIPRSLLLLRQPQVPRTLLL